MKKPLQIVVVCRGNIARSPFAEAIVKQELVKRNLANVFQVSSRGVQGTTIDPEPVKHSNIVCYDELYRDLKPVFMACDVDLSKHASMAIDGIDARDASVIFAMDEDVRVKLMLLFPVHVAKIHLLSEIASKQVGFSDPETANNRAPILLEIKDMIVQNFPALLAITENAQRYNVS